MYLVCQLSQWRRSSSAAAAYDENSTSFITNFFSIFYSQTTRDGFPSRQTRQLAKATKLRERHMSEMLFSFYFTRLRQPIGGISLNPLLLTTRLACVILRALYAALETLHASPYRQLIFNKTSNTEVTDKKEASTMRYFWFIDTAVYLIKTLLSFVLHSCLIFILFVCFIVLLFFYLMMNKRLVLTVH